MGRSRMRHDTRTPEGGHPNVRQLELRRHARRDPHADRLSAAGRAQAEDVGRAATATYDVVFVSPAQRAAETAAWFLRGAGQQLPDHEVVPGLGGQDATGGSPDGMAAGVRALLERVPDGGRGLAISHTPAGGARRARPDRRRRRAARGVRGDPGARSTTARSPSRSSGSTEARQTRELDVAHRSRVRVGVRAGSRTRPRATPAPHRDGQARVLGRPPRDAGRERHALPRDGGAGVRVLVARPERGPAPGAPRGRRWVPDLPGRRRAAARASRGRRSRSHSSRRCHRRWARRCGASCPWC